MTQRDVLTVRFPSDLLSRARAVKNDDESLNDLVVSAVDREVRRRQGLQAHEAIMRVREQVLAQTGPQPDSTPLIRSLREGNDRA